MRDITIPMSTLRPARTTIVSIVAGVLAVTAWDHVVSSESAPLLGPVDVLGAPIESLSAAAFAGSDVDQDGLSDEQEVVLGTVPFFEDSDGDGYNDGEEVARQSNPLDDTSIPMTGGISASMTARGANDRLHLVICLHEPAGEIGFAKMRIGALTPQGVVSVPIGRFLGLANVSSSPGSEASEVTTIDIPIHPGFVHAAQHVTFFLAAGNQMDPSFGSAATVEVLSTDGVLQLKRPLAVNQGQQSLVQGGAIRQPIPQSATPAIPPTWIPGAVCYQRTAVVGGSGAIVLKQVVDADCIQGWDTYCVSDCEGTVGSTFETIDPVALIGG